MKFLCLIHLDPVALDAMPPRELDALNGAHLDLNDRLRASGHFVEAEALVPAKETRCVRVRNGKTSVVDGPFAETKEVIAGFYLLEAEDLEEAVAIAAQIPSAPRATIEVRAAQELVVPGR